MYSQNEDDNKLEGSKTEHLKESIFEATQC